MTTLVGYSKSVGQKTTELESQPRLPDAAKERLQSVGWGGTLREKGRLEYDAWAQGQATTAALSCPEAGVPTRAMLADSLLALFDPPDDRIKRFEPGYGWLLFAVKTEERPYPSAVGAAWVLPALARLLATPGDLGADRRARLETQLEEVQHTLDRYQATAPPGDPQPEAWNLFPNQRDRRQANLFVTATVFLGLLEMQRAGLGWHGDRGRASDLLRRTQAGLVARFDGTGWRSPGPTGSDEVVDGLTLWLFCLLLRAEADAGLALPDQIVRRVRESVSETAARPLEHPNSVAVYKSTFAYGGKQYNEEWRVIRFLRFPWAVEMASRWVARCERTGAGRGEMVVARRAMGRLLLGHGERAVAEAGAGATFVAADLLLGLSGASEP